MDIPITASNYRFSCQKINTLAWALVYLASGQFPINKIRPALQQQIIHIYDINIIVEIKCMKDIEIDSAVIDLTGMRLIWKLIQGDDTDMTDQ